MLPDLTANYPLTEMVSRVWRKLLALFVQSAIETFTSKKTKHCKGTSYMRYRNSFIHPTGR